MFEYAVSLICRSVGTKGKRWLSSIYCPYTERSHGAMQFKLKRLPAVTALRHGPLSLWQSSHCEVVMTSPPWLLLISLSRQSGNRHYVLLKWSIHSKIWWVGLRCSSAHHCATEQCLLAICLLEEILVILLSSLLATMCFVHMFCLWHSN